MGKVEHEVHIRRLAPEDDRSVFQCGNIDLDRLFQRYAGQNQFRHHIEITYVVCPPSDLHALRRSERDDTPVSGHWVFHAERQRTTGRPRNGTDARERETVNSINTVLRTLTPYDLRKGAGGTILNEHRASKKVPKKQFSVEKWAI